MGIKPSYAVFAVLLLGTTVFADGPRVVSELVAQKVVVDKAGAEQRESADAAKPGDLIEYVAVYKIQDRALAEFQPVIPVPSGLVFEPGEAEGAPTEASLDGKTFAPIPLTRLVTQPDGTKTRQPVPLSEYRFVRWPARDVDAHAVVVVKARARVAISER